MQARQYVFENKTINFPQNWTSAEIAQLGERQTEDLKVPGSKPESPHGL